MLVFDLQQNEKQADYFDTVMSATAGGNDLRIFSYGGAIRGGKTSVTLFILFILCKMYPGSRWHIVRESFPNLEQTTIPSFEKFYPSTAQSISYYNRSKSNFFVHFRNGSRIYFTSQQISRDPELNWANGIETNGIFLEQAEELSEKMFNKALERAGSWYVEPMPPAFLFLTFNPNQTWVKDKFFIPWKEGRLESPYHYLPALPTDSPFITSDQWVAWSNMDSISYAQFVEGDWEAFASEKRFAHAFNETVHVTPTIEINEEIDIYLSFDFNHNPVTCVAGQHWDDNIRLVKEFTSNVGLGDLCKKILLWIGDRIVWVTGDKSGWNQSELLEGNRTAYDLIMNYLEISKYQNDAPHVNPNFFKSRELVNGVLENYESFLISKTGCPELIKDLKFVEADNKHQIIKNRNKQEGKADLLDCFRYYLNTWFENFIRL